jgi:hypothetical protein
MSSLIPNVPKPCGGGNYRTKSYDLSIFSISIILYFLFTIFNLSSRFAGIRWAQLNA